MTMNAISPKCPCGSERPHETCCGPYLAGRDTPKTAEALMRSRYCAFVFENVDYLEATSGGSAKDGFSAKDALSWSRNATFTNLTVHATEQGGEDDSTGVVEFSATYTENGKVQVLHERSIFERTDGAWRYMGRIKNKPVARETPKVGRNDPCPCGSGQKFKKCCGR
jgi:SEC-C motif domain protein